MTKAEAVAVVRRLARSYNATVDDDLMDVWFHSALYDIGVDEALGIVLDLVASREFMPRPAHFNDARRSARRPDRRTTEAEALDPGDYSRAVGQAWMPHIRAGLAAVGNGGIEPSQRKHTSDRWEDCEVCRETARQVAVEVGQ